MVFKKHMNIAHKGTHKFLKLVLSRGAHTVNEFFSVVTKFYEKILNFSQKKQGNIKK